MTERTKRPRVALIGAGFMGRGIFWQSRWTGAFDCVAVFDKNIHPFLSFTEENQVPHVRTASLTEMERAISNGALAVCSEVRQIIDSGMIDAVIDATPDIQESVIFCAEVLGSKKHLIMVNSESDLMFGAYFAEIARANGVVYTSCDGDQYGVLKRMIDEIKVWGFDVVMAGNIKGFLNRYAIQSTMGDEADKRGLNHKMCTAYTDGTKLNIEMALIANSEGFISKTKGMLGPELRHVDDVLTAFDFEALWKDRVPFVDYVLGAEPGGGVFAVGYCDAPFQRKNLAYYKMGDGPFYVFYRPYHLCHLEATSTVLDAVLRKQGLMQPKPDLTTNVFAYAKKDLQAGAMLDGVGGDTCYGLIENLADQKNGEGLPICLADGVIVKSAVKKDEKILLAHAAYDPLRPDYATYYRIIGSSN